MNDQFFGLDYFVLIYLCNLRDQEVFILFVFGFFGLGFVDIKVFFVDFVDGFRLQNKKFLEQKRDYSNYLI